MWFSSPTCSVDFTYPSLWGHSHRLAVGDGSDDVFLVEKHISKFPPFILQSQSKYKSQEMKLPNRTGKERH